MKVIGQRKQGVACGFNQAHRLHDDRSDLHFKSKLANSLGNLHASWSEEHLHKKRPRREERFQQWTKQRRNQQVLRSCWSAALHRESLRTTEARRTDRLWRGVAFIKVSVKDNTVAIIMFYSTNQIVSFFNRTQLNFSFSCSCRISYADGYECNNAVNKAKMPLTGRVSIQMHHALKRLLATKPTAVLLRFPVLFHRFTASR